MRVRNYEVTPLTSGRWKVVNTENAHEYVTYGTEDEVVTQLTKQAELLVKKRDPRHTIGAAWRNTMTKTPTKA